VTTRVQISQQEAEKFIYHESLLIDRGLLEDWQRLFTEDGVYWIPMEEDVDPTLEPSVLYDNQERLALRIYQLLYTPHWSQRPPSMTTHLTTNVVVEEEESSPDEVLVTCSLLCGEIRRGDHRQLGLGIERMLAGRCEYRLRLTDDGWRMAMKKVILLSRFLPFRNLSFLI